MPAAWDALLRPDAGREDVKAVVARLLGDLKASVAEKQMPISFSVGVVSCADGTCPPEDLIKTADDLMYGVKSRGKDGVAYIAYTALPVEDHSAERPIAAKPPHSQE